MYTPTLQQFREAIRSNTKTLRELERLEDEAIRNGATLQQLLVALFEAQSHKE